MVQKVTLLLTYPEKKEINKRSSLGITRKSLGLTFLGATRHEYMILAESAYVVGKGETEAIVVRSDSVVGPDAEGVGKDYLLLRARDGIPGLRNDISLPQ